MQTVHPIGTAIRVGDESTFVVAGYRLHEEGDMTGLAYLLIPYPLGYLDERSFCSSTIDIKHEVLFEGYADDVTRAYLMRLAELDEKARQASYEDIMLLMEALRLYLDEPSEEEGDADE